LPKQPRTRDEAQLAQTLRTFHVVRARRGEIVVSRNRLRIVFRQLEPHRAAVLVRRGLLDEAPVPLGDVRAALLDRTVKGAVRQTPLTAFDALDASRLPPRLREALSVTADRRDYARLVPEDPDAAAPSPSARLFRAVRRTIPGLPRVQARVRVEGDASLRYGAMLLVASWRDLGLNVRIVQRGANTFFTRRTPARGIVIARAVDARFVSPRVSGWRENAQGVVDYARVTLR
jgi:hypothetical protein